MTLLPIVLPLGFIPKVSVNDKLTKGALLAEKKGSLSEQIINLFKDYKIPLSDISKSLKKNLGDYIHTGEVVAIKSGRFLGGNKKILSQFSGTVAKIDEGSGEVTIKTAESVEKAEQMFSPVEGKVEICNNEKIVIKTSLDAIIAEDALGAEAEGKIYYIKNVLENSLNLEVRDKVLFIKTIDKAMIFKAIGLDVLGIITQDLEDTDFIELADKKINIPLMILSEDNFGKVAKHSEANIYLNGKDKSLIFYE